MAKDTEIEAVHRYVDSRRQAVRGFVDEMFSFEASWTVHRKCLKKDVAINLINSCLAIPLLTLKKVAIWLEKIGWEKAEGLPGRIPGGFSTRFQRHVEKSLCSSFFGSAGPFQAGTQLEGAFQKILKKEIRELSLQRASTTDLLTSVLPIGVGYLCFNHAAASASEVGQQIAAVFARKKAVSEFFLGESAGSVFYSIFPARPSDSEVMVFTALVILLFAVLSLFLRLVSDPLQKKLGVHERRMHALLDSLEMKLLFELHRQFKAKA